MTPTGLILDFGEVLTRPQRRDAAELMASLVQLPFEEFLARYWRHRPAYDGGLAVEEYWRRVVERTDALPPAMVNELVEADALSWTDYRGDVWDIAAAFRGRGHRTAMLSNGVPEIIARVRAARPLENWFDVVIVSCEVGWCK